MYENAVCMDAGIKVFDRDPPVETRYDTLYIPRIPGHYDAEYGLYDPYGRLIQTAGPRRGWPNASLGQNQSCCVSPSSAFPTAPDLLYFYGGNITNHFGHFLTETLPRYWLGRQSYQGLRILVHAEKSLEELFSLTWIRELFDLLGLCRDDFVVFDRPTRLRAVIVAGSAFEENHFAHHALARFCNDLGERYGEQMTDSAPLYLTRSGFQSQMRVILGEDEVATRLHHAGFMVISPEALSIRQQIGLFSSHRPTAGFVGSAFHNSIFCARPIGVALCCDGLVSSNYVLMDQVNRARMIYAQTPGIRTEKFVIGEPAIYRLTDPSRVARHFCDLVQQGAWAQVKNDDPPTRVDRMPDRALRTAHDTCLQIDRQTGLLRHGSGGGTRIEKVLVGLDDHGWAALTTSTGDCLSVEQNTQQGAVVFFRYQRLAHDRVALKNHATGRFLCALPDGRVCCDRLVPDGWEQFTPIVP